MCFPAALGLTVGGEEGVDVNDVLQETPLSRGSLSTLDVGEDLCLGLLIKGLELLELRSLLGLESSLQHLI